MNNSDQNLINFKLAKGDNYIKINQSCPSIFDLIQELEFSDTFEPPVKIRLMRIKNSDQYSELFIFKILIIN